MKINNILLSTLLLASTSTGLLALDVKGVVGLHNNYIPGRQHHTFGVGIGVYAEHETQNNVKMSGYFDWFFDDDDEEIDHDRYSNWFQSGFNVNGLVTDFSNDTNLLWEAEGDMRYNTVTSIESYYKGFVGLMPQYHSNDFLAGIGIYGGYYYFEFDDDLPATAGFHSEELTYESMAYCIKGKTTYKVSNDLDFIAVAKQYRDDNDWLQNQVLLDLVYDISNLVDNSEIIFNTEYNRYNLSNAESDAGTNFDRFREEEWNTRLFVRIAF